MDDPSHRPIELQSPEDLTYLIDNVRRAAADSINAAFPPVDNGLDGQEDELRNRIEQLVNDVGYPPPSPSPPPPPPTLFPSPPSTPSTTNPTQPNPTH